MYTSLQEAEYQMTLAAYSAVSYLTMLVNQNGGKIKFHNQGPSFSDYDKKVIGLYVDKGSLYFYDEEYNDVLLENECDLGRLYKVVEYLNKNNVW